MLRAAIGKLETQLQYESGFKKDLKEQELIDAEKQLKELESVEQPARDLGRSVLEKQSKWSAAKDSREIGSVDFDQIPVKPEYLPKSVHSYFKGEIPRLRSLIAGAPVEERNRMLAEALNYRRVAEEHSLEYEQSIKRNRQEGAFDALKDAKTMDTVRERWEQLSEKLYEMDHARKGFEELMRKAEALHEGTQVDLASAEAASSAKTLEREERDILGLHGVRTPKQRKEIPSVREAAPEADLTGNKEQPKKKERKKEGVVDRHLGKVSDIAAPAEAVAERRAQILGNLRAGAKPGVSSGTFGTIPTGTIGSFASTAPHERVPEGSTVTSKEKFSPEQLARAYTFPQKEKPKAPLPDQEYYRPQGARTVLEGNPMGHFRAASETSAAAAADAGAEAVEAEKTVLEPVRPLVIESLLKGDLSNIGVTAQAEADRYYDELTAKERLPFISPYQRELNRLRGDIGYTARELAETKSDRKRKKLIEQLRKEAAEMLAIGALLIDQAGAAQAAQTGAEYTPVMTPEERALVEGPEEKPLHKRKSVWFAGGGLLAAFAAFFATQGNHHDSKKSPIHGTKVEQPRKPGGGAIGAGGKHEASAAAAAAEKAGEVKVTFTEEDVTKPHGAEEAIQRLKDHLSKVYGGPKESNPKNVNKILRENPHNLATAFGFYNRDTGESTVMYKGDAFKIDTHGILTFTSVDHPKGKLITLLDASGAAKGTVASLKRETMKFVPYQAHLNAQRQNVRVTYNQPHPLQREAIVTRDAVAQTPGQPRSTSASQIPAAVKPQSTLNSPSLDDFIAQQSKGDAARSTSTPATADRPPSTSTGQGPASLDDWVRQQSPRT